MDPILIFTHLLNGLLMIAMPVLLGFYIARKFKLGWRIWWIGAATFILSQIGHIPFNAAVGLLFERGFLNLPSAVSPLVFSAIFGGLSAGIWEETFRYGAFRWWAKDARSWSKAMMLGAGWGGSEAIVIGLLVLVNYAVMVAAQFGDLSSVMPADQLTALNEQLSLYWSLPWYMTLLGALERAFALTIQVCLSVIVMQAFTRRKIIWLFLAIGWHALVDALAVYLSRTSGVAATEAVIGLAAIISAFVVFLLRQPEPEQIPAGAENTSFKERIPSLSLSHEELSADRLDASKYD